jgi:hypothetical protein
MSAALETKEDAIIVEELIFRLCGIAIKPGFDATLFAQTFRKNKTEKTPISPRFAFYGDSESLRFEKLPDGRLVVTIILKPKAAQ